MSSVQLSETKSSWKDRGASATPVSCKVLLLVSRKRTIAHALDINFVSVQEIPTICKVPHSFIQAWTEHFGRIIGGFGLILNNRTCKAVKDIHGHGIADILYRVIFSRMQKTRKTFR